MSSVKYVIKSPLNKFMDRSENEKFSSENLWILVKNGG